MVSHGCRPRRHRRPDSIGRYERERGNLGERGFLEQDAPEDWLSAGACAGVDEVYIVSCRYGFNTVALGPPLLAAVIGGVGAWIALQQMHLARVKLQHDTYDRKYAVFAAVHWLLTGISAFKRAPNLVDMRDFINEIGAASFLFDDKLVAYLREIESRVHRAHGLNEMMDNFPEESKAALSKELAEHIAWLGEQSGVITEKFRHHWNTKTALPHLPMAAPPLGLLRLKSSSLRHFANPASAITPLPNQGQGAEGPEVPLEKSRTSLTEN